MTTARFPRRSRFRLSRARARGFGPAFMFGNKNFSVVGKWLYDADADNRLEGDLYMLSFVARFGGEPPPPPMPVAPPPVARVEPPPPPPPPPPADADGDGVPDLSDLCPATPRGDRVDVNGCSCDVTVQVHFRSNSTEITGADAIPLNSLADQVRKLPTHRRRARRSYRQPGTRKHSMSICRDAARWRPGTTWRRGESMSRSWRWPDTANRSRSRTTPRRKGDSRIVAWSCAARTARWARRVNTMRSINLGHQHLRRHALA